MFIKKDVIKKRLIKKNKKGMGQYMMKDFGFAFNEHQGQKKHEYEQHLQEQINELERRRQALRAHYYYSSTDQQNQLNDSKAKITNRSS